MVDEIVMNVDEDRCDEHGALIEKRRGVGCGTDN
jgi:hypothetical protein